MYKETHSENSTRVRWHSRLKRDTVKLITGSCFILALFRKWQHEKIKKNKLKKGKCFPKENLCDWCLCEQILKHVLY